MPPRARGVLRGHLCGTRKTFRDIPRQSTLHRGAERPVSAEKRPCFNGLHALHWHND